MKRRISQFLVRIAWGISIFVAMVGSLYYLSEGDRINGQWKCRIKSNELLTDFDIVEQVRLRSLYALERHKKHPRYLIAKDLVGELSGALGKCVSSKPIEQCLHVHLPNKLLIIGFDADNVKSDVEFLNVDKQAPISFKTDIGKLGCVESEQNIEASSID